MKDGEVQLENTCADGDGCKLSHSKDEVLYHPHLFKTVACKDHHQWLLEQSQPTSRNSKSARCHRYYCPFAHGNEELRESPLPRSTREKLVADVLEQFPHDECCEVCSPSCISKRGVKVSNPQARKGSGKARPQNLSNVDKDIMSRDWMQTMPFNGCSSSVTTLMQTNCGQSSVPNMRIVPCPQMMQLMPMQPGCIPGGAGGMQIVQLAVPVNQGCNELKPGTTPLPMMQFGSVGSLPSNEGQQSVDHTKDGSTSVSKILEEANLQHLDELLRRNGIDTIEDLCTLALSEDRLENMCLSPNDALRLSKAAEGCRSRAEQKSRTTAQATGTYCMVPAGGAMPAAVMMNGFGQWMSPTCGDGYPMMWPQPISYCAAPQPVCNNGGQFMQVPAWGGQEQNHSTQQEELRKQPQHELQKQGIRQQLFLQNKQQLPLAQQQFSNHQMQGFQQNGEEQWQQPPLHHPQTTHAVPCSVSEVGLSALPNLQMISTPSPHKGANTVETPPRSLAQQHEGRSIRLRNKAFDENKGVQLPGTPQKMSRGRLNTSPCTNPLPQTF